MIGTGDDNNNKNGNNINNTINTPPATVQTPPRRTRSLLGPLAFWEDRSDGRSRSNSSRRERAKQWLMNSGLTGNRARNESDPGSAPSAVTTTPKQKAQQEEAPSTPVAPPFRRGGQQRLRKKQVQLPPPFGSSARRLGPTPRVSGGV